jgi:pyruvate dehydrogenase E1 component beta subunit
MRCMTGGQVCLPLVIRCGNGGGARFGAQHSQSIENWAMAIPGLKVVAPSTPAEVKGLLAAAIRDDDPVIFCEQKALYGKKGDVPDGEYVLPLGEAARLRAGNDVTIVGLAATVGMALEAAEELAVQQDIEADVIDLRCLVPFDTQSILSSVKRIGRLVIVEETPRPLGWGAEVSSIVMEEAFEALKRPVLRVTTAPVPLPAAPELKDLARPSVDRTVRAVMSLF